MQNSTSTLPTLKRQYARGLEEQLERQNLGPSLLPWTIRCRPMLVPERPFDLVRHPYLVDLYNQTAREIVVYKAGQMGASEWAVSRALWSADQRGATVLYIFPTDTHVSDFSSARIGPAIEASPYLAGIVIEGSAGQGKRGADRVTLKRVRNRFIYLRGGQVDTKGNAPQLKSIDADVVMLDELDEMDPRAPAIARKRLGHSQLAEVCSLSTPTYGGVGIHAEWLRSDQREWYVRCEHCGERQPLTIHQVVTEWDNLQRPVCWHGGPNRAFIACRSCGQELNRLAPGEWVATHPGREVVGYHLSHLFSPTASLLAIVQALQSADETTRKECVNQDLGEPYTPRGGQLTKAHLDACRREYGHGPVPNEETFMGVDVGGVLHVVIRGRIDPVSGERPQRWAGAVDWDDLDQLMLQYHVAVCVMDALPETTKAREFQSHFAPGRVWLSYYPNQKVGSKRAVPVDFDEVNVVVDLDRTRTLDTLYGRFYAPLNTLPANARDIPHYYDHLVAPVRILEAGPGGKPVARYVESSPDHFAHAENYCAVATVAPRLTPPETVYDESMRVQVGY